MHVEKIVLDEIFFLKFKLPEYLLKILNEEISEIKEKKFKGATPYNYTLAGAIEHEYVLFNSADAIENFFSSNTFQLPRNTKLLYTTNNSKDIPSLWVNFQKKYEYNPLHYHEGRFSFVIWLNIPYDLEIEKTMPHTQSGTVSCLPSFQFVYSPVFSNPKNHVSTYHINVDKTYEGTGILFPNNLQHLVTPFYTSDDYRISVSGNLII